MIGLDASWVIPIGLAIVGVAMYVRLIVDHFRGRK
jgi:hypothetical protein